MSGYDATSCSALEKVYYRPIEAALRWCGLIANEVEILSVVGNNHMPTLTDFPQWPCLRINTEKILSAIQNGKLRYGRDGVTVPNGEHVAKHRLTVDHADLKKWMSENYLDQKPLFLFDEVERQLHVGITIGAFQTLEAENKVLNIRLEKAKEVYLEQKEKISLLERENSSLSATSSTGNTIDSRTEKSYLNIIGGLIAIILGKSSRGQQHSIFETQGSIIDIMLAYYEGKYGISSTNLEKRFAEANKSIKE